MSYIYHRVQVLEVIEDGQVHQLSIIQLDTLTYMRKMLEVDLSVQKEESTLKNC